MLGSSTWNLLGLGRITKDDNEVYFCVIDWPAANAIRQVFNLPARDIHITLGYKKSDIHNVTKDASSLILRCRGNGESTSIPEDSDEETSESQTESEKPVEQKEVEELAQHFAQVTQVTPQEELQEAMSEFGKFLANQMSQTVKEMKPSLESTREQEVEDDTEEKTAEYQNLQNILNNPEVMFFSLFFVFERLAHLNFV